MPVQILLPEVVRRKHHRYNTGNLQMFPVISHMPMDHSGFSQIRNLLSFLVEKL